MVSILYFLLNNASFHNLFSLYFDGPFNKLNKLTYCSYKVTYRQNAGGASY